MVIMGIARNVLIVMSQLNVNITSLSRTYRRPPLSSSPGGRRVVEGWCAGRCNEASATTTRKNDTPLSAKHPAAPIVASTAAPALGPSTRDRLNWLELRA